MSVAKQIKKCPLCLEPILVGAARCKHCQADLAAAKGKRLAKYQTFRMGFLTGLLFSLILAVLAWAHLFGGDG